MIRSILTAAMVLTLGAAVPASADEQPEIRFARGAISASMTSSVVRGDRDIYPINAGAGQTMTVEITSLEDNAVFQIYPPGTHFMQDENDIWMFHGEPVRGADGDTRTWTGELRSGGRYLIVVGGTRGNATYRLNVRIE